jgi:hypothetical protein
VRRAEQLLSPVSRELASMLARLTPSQWEALQRGTEIVFSSAQQAGELPLPEATVTRFQAARPDLSYGFRGGGPEVAEFKRQEEAQRQDRWQSATGYRIAIRLDASELAQGGVFRLLAETTPFRGGGANEFAFPGGPGTRLELGGGWSDGTEARDQEAQHANEMAKDPVLGTGREFNPSTLPGISPWVAGFWWLRDLLPALARTFDVDFISDAYWNQAPVLTRQMTQGPVRLYQLLNRAAGPTQRWNRQGRLVRMRSRSWFFLRRREVPLRRRRARNPRRRTARR